MFVASIILYFSLFVFFPVRGAPGKHHILLKVIELDQAQIELERDVCNLIKDQENYQLCKEYLTNYFSEVNAEEDDEELIKQSVFTFEYETLGDDETPLDDQQKYERLLQEFEDLIDSLHPEENEVIEIMFVEEKSVDFWTFFDIKFFLDQYSTYFLFLFGFTFMISGIYLLTYEEDEEEDLPKYLEIIKK